MQIGIGTLRATFNVPLLLLLSIDPSVTLNVMMRLCLMKPGRKFIQSITEMICLRSEDFHSMELHHPGSTSRKPSIVLSLVSREAFKCKGC